MKNALKDQCIKLSRHFYIKGDTAFCQLRADNCVGEPGFSSLFQLDIRDTTPITQETIHTDRTPFQPSLSTMSPVMDAVHPAARYEQKSRNPAMDDTLLYLAKFMGMTPSKRVFAPYMAADESPKKIKPAIGLNLPKYTSNRMENIPEAKSTAVASFSLLPSLLFSHPAIMMPAKFISGMKTKG